MIRLDLDAKMARRSSSEPTMVPIMARSLRAPWWKKMDRCLSSSGGSSEDQGQIGCAPRNSRTSRVDTADLKSSLNQRARSSFRMRDDADNPVVVPGDFKIETIITVHPSLPYVVPRFDIFLGLYRWMPKVLGSVSHKRSSCLSTARLSRDGRAA